MSAHVYGSPASAAAINCRSGSVKSSSSTTTCKIPWKPASVTGGRVPAFREHVELNITVAGPPGLERGARRYAIAAERFGGDRAGRLSLLDFPGGAASFWQ